MWLTGKIIIVIIHMPAIVITKPGLKMFSSRILMGTKGRLKHLSIIFLFAYIDEALHICQILCISFLIEVVHYCICVICMNMIVFTFVSLALKAPKVYKPHAYSIDQLV